MQLQGTRVKRRHAASRSLVWPALFARLGWCLIVVLLVTACTPAARTTTPAETPGLAPADLLRVFLRNERAQSPAVLSFNARVVVEDQEPHELRGVAGYTNCGDLRLKLVGAVGLTLLDYVNVAGNGVLVVDKLTPEDDGAARDGLLHLMRVFTLALTDRCEAGRSLVPVSQDAESVTFAAASHRGAAGTFSLDRQTAAVRRQTVTGGAPPDGEIHYGQFQRVGDYWMPSTMTIRMGDTPLSVELEITRWRLGADLPGDFFATP